MPGRTFDVDRASASLPSLLPSAAPMAQATVRARTQPLAAVIQRARLNPRALTRADLAQLHRSIGNAAVGRLLTGAPAPNRTGLPDGLKARAEAASGLSLDDVRVHRASTQPAEVQAHAYARGTNIHLAPGQERHLPHETWHVVQQKQGRVRPTLDVGGTAVNDDAALEREAQSFAASPSPAHAGLGLARSADDVLQRVVHGLEGLTIDGITQGMVQAYRADLLDSRTHLYKDDIEAYLDQNKPDWRSNYMLTSAGNHWSVIRQGGSSSGGMSQIDFVPDGSCGAYAALYICGHEDFQFNTAGERYADEAAVRPVRLFIQGRYRDDHAIRGLILGELQAQDTLAFTGFGPALMGLLEVFEQSARAELSAQVGGHPMDFVHDAAEAEQEGESSTGDVASTTPPRSTEGGGAPIGEGRRRADKASDAVIATTDDGLIWRHSGDGRYIFIPDYSRDLRLPADVLRSAGTPLPRREAVKLGLPVDRVCRAITIKHGLVYGNFSEATGKSDMHVSPGTSEMHMDIGDILAAGQELLRLKRIQEDDLGLGGGDVLLRALGSGAVKRTVDLLAYAFGTGLGSRLDLLKVRWLRELRKRKPKPQLDPSRMHPDMIQEHLLSLAAIRGSGLVMIPQIASMNPAHRAQTLEEFQRNMLEDSAQGRAQFDRYSKALSDERETMSPGLEITLSYDQLAQAILRLKNLKG